MLSRSQNRKLIAQVVKTARLEVVTARTSATVMTTVVEATATAVAVTAIVATDAVGRRMRLSQRSKKMMF